MSTPAPTPAPGTPDAAAAAAAAASDAATRGATREEVRTEVAAALAAQQADATVHLSDEQLDRIATRTIEHLDQRGAFHDDQTPGTPPPVVTPEGQPPVQQTPPAPGTTPDPAVPADIQPRKRTWAEKFVGRE